jgi:hypothetical protein
MGSFKDLPKDVMWLIFKQLIAHEITSKPYYFRHLFMFELPDAQPTPFCLDFEYLTCLMLQLALISKFCLKLIRSKCVKINYVFYTRPSVGWLFTKGALTD